MLFRNTCLRIFFLPFKRGLSMEDVKGAFVVTLIGSLVALAMAAYGLYKEAK